MEGAGCVVQSGRGLLGATGKRRQRVWGGSDRAILARKGEHQKGQTAGLPSFSSERPGSKCLLYHLILPHMCGT